MAEELLDASDGAEIQKLKMQQIKIQESLTQRAKLLEGRFTKGRVCRKKPLNLRPGMQLQEVRSLIPQTKGCHLYLEEAWHRRWAAEYLQREEGQKHFKRSFADEAGEVEACRACIRWLWAVHTETIGLSEPWEW